MATHWKQQHYTTLSLSCRRTDVHTTLAWTQTNGFLRLCKCFVNSYLLWVVSNKTCPEEDKTTGLLYVLTLVLFILPTQPDRHSLSVQVNIKTLLEEVFHISCSITWIRFSYFLQFPLEPQNAWWKCYFLIPVIRKHILMSKSVQFKHCFIMKLIIRYHWFGLVRHFLSMGQIIL